MVFNSYLQQSFNNLLEVVENMESEWAMFHTAIAETAARSCGSKVAGASCDGKPQDPLVDTRGERGCQADE